MQETIGIFTRMLRLEDTAHQAIQSVLTQSFTDLRYYILVSEKTEEMVKEYARSDERITMLYNRETESFDKYSAVMAERHRYIFQLDGDDWLDPNCIEVMYRYAEENALDMVICGNYWVKDGQVVGQQRECNENMCMSKIEVLNRLPWMYQFLRTVWGKLFSSAFLKRTEKMLDISDWDIGAYGADTLVVFYLLEYAEKLGFVKGSFYYYRLSLQSVSNVLDKKRVESDSKLFYYVSEVLKKYNLLCEGNRRFLLEVYANAVRDTLQTVANAKISELERQALFDEILSHPLTVELLQREANRILSFNGVGAEDNQIFRKSYAMIIFYGAGMRGEIGKYKQEYHKLFFKLFPSYTPYFTEELLEHALQDEKLLEGCIQKNPMMISVELLSRFGRMSEQAREDVLAFLREVSGNELLNSVLISTEFVLAHIRILLMIAFGQLERAQEECLHGLQEEGENNYFHKERIELLLNLSAVISDVDGFLYGKLCKLEYLIKVHEFELAESEYLDLVEMGVDSNVLEPSRKALENVK